MKKSSKKNKGGRPFIWNPNLPETAQKMQSCIDEFFDEEEHKTICGLALHLGFIDRQSIYDYIKRNDHLSCIIKKAVFRIENEYEKNLSGQNKPTGSIFALKNMGWKDTLDANVSVSNLADIAALMGANDD